MEWSGLDWAGLELGYLELDLAREELRALVDRADRPDVEEDDAQRAVGRADWAELEARVPAWPVCTAITRTAR